jgi:hypothetical protein
MPAIHTERQTAVESTSDGKATERLMAADAQAARAARRLRELQAWALGGARYDPDEFDTAILAHRRAQTEAAAARMAWVRRRRLHQTRGVGRSAA